MKRILALFLILSFSVSYGGEALTIDLTTWLAPDSEYGEYPGPDALPQNYIWGKFPSDFFKLDVQLQIWDRIYVRLGGQYGIILPSTMYLDSITNSLSIQGDLWGFHTDLAYRLGENSRGYLDIYAGFVYTAAVKHLGAAGDYNIVLFGAQLGVKAKSLFTDHFGMYGEVYGFPLFENSTSFPGVPPQLIEESAKGYRYGFDTAFVLEYDWITVRAGVQYERIYYASGPYATHDLGIRYAGPYITLGFRIDTWGPEHPVYVQ